MWSAGQHVVFHTSVLTHALGQRKAAERTGTTAKQTGAKATAQTTETATAQATEAATT